MQRYANNDHQFTLVLTCRLAHGQASLYVAENESEQLSVWSWFRHRKFFILTNQQANLIQPHPE